MVEVPNVKTVPVAPLHGHHCTRRKIGERDRAKLRETAKKELERNGNGGGKVLGRAHSKGRGAAALLLPECAYSPWSSFSFTVKYPIWHVISFPPPPQYPVLSDADSRT